MGVRGCVVCGGTVQDAEVGRGGSGCGGPGSIAPWLTRGPPKAGLAASYIYFYVNVYLQYSKDNLNDFSLNVFSDEYFSNDK